MKNVGVYLVQRKGQKLQARVWTVYIDSNRIWCLRQIESERMQPQEIAQFGLLSLVKLSSSFLAIVLSNFTYISLLLHTCKFYRRYAQYTFLTFVCASTALHTSFGLDLYRLAIKKNQLDGFIRFNSQKSDVLPMLPTDFTCVMYDKDGDRQSAVIEISQLHFSVPDHYTLFLHKLHQPYLRGVFDLKKPAYKMVIGVSRWNLALLTLDIKFGRCFSWSSSILKLSFSLFNVFATPSVTARLFEWHFWKVLLTGWTPFWWEDNYIVLT